MPPHADPGFAPLALTVIDRIPAMIAYWDRDEICRFANDAYQRWFGRSRDELIGTRLCDLLGPIYPLNRPFIQGALAGEEQVFERQIPVPNGPGIRDSIATYTPDKQDGMVVGFFVHVADVTLLKAQERHLAQLVQERDRALAEVRTLHGLLRICAGCKRIRDATGKWTGLEEYVCAHTDASFTHGLCQECAQRLYPDLVVPTDL
ncbi:MAG: PAS domain-containing protein [Gemmatimonadales bacterium]